MKKNLHVSKDPKLNRIFTKAYYATLREVERRERDKTAQDHIEAYVELFERELDSRDLSYEEQRKFVEAFKSQMEHADRLRFQRRKNRKLFSLIGGGSLAAVALLVFILYAGIKKPFMPLSKVETDLQYYLEKVDAGYGDFSKKYYSNLRRFEGRLGSVKTARYRQDMYTELDEHFQEFLEKLQNGEVAYIDDARRWADYFPEKEERKARKKIATNAIVGGVGENIGEAVKSILDGAKDVIDRTIDAIDNK